jgi:ribose transport system ATP-binding protein
MDEPTAALNNAEVEQLFGIIRDLKTEGVGIIYITHKMDEVRRVADRVTIMRDGSRVATLADAAAPIETIIALMVGRELGDVGRVEPTGPPGEEALRAVGLRRGKTIRDVSFSVRKGEILGLAGLMGAGRTEVARAVFGADRLDAGEIYVHGKKVTIGSPADAVGHGVAYLSEDRKRFGLVTPITVEQNITIASWPRHLWGRMFLRHAMLKNTASTYVDRLRVKTPSLFQETRLLSGGNQQKIVVAKWLARDCDILLFDEPTRGIDVGAKAEIYKLLQMLAEQGRAIVVISSELPEILRLSHRILVMCEGRITGELDGKNATQEAIMRLATQRELAKAG